MWSFLPEAGVTELLGCVSLLPVPFALHVSVWRWSLWSPLHMLTQTSLLHCSQGIHVFLFQRCIRLTPNTQRPAVPSASRWACHIFYDALPGSIFVSSVIFCVLPERRKRLVLSGLVLSVSICRAWNDYWVKSWFIFSSQFLSAECECRCRRRPSSVSPQRVLQLNADFFRHLVNESCAWITHHI